MSWHSPGFGQRYISWPSSQKGPQHASAKAKARSRNRAFATGYGAKTGLRRLLLDQLFGRLRTTAWTLGKRRLDLLDRLGLGDVLHHRNLTRQAVERRFVKLPLAIGLLGLRLPAIEVAHDLGDRHDVAGIDLARVFLGAARPDGALYAWLALEGLERALDQAALGELAHADRGNLGGGDPQRHLVLDEIDDEQLKLGASDLLLLDCDDLAASMSRVDDELVGLEA